MTTRNLLKFVSILYHELKIHSAQDLIEMTLVHPSFRKLLFSWLEIISFAII